MTREEAQTLAAGICNRLPYAMRQRLKSIHVMPHLHNGHLTIRVFMYNVTAEDPDPFIFGASEI